MITITPAKNEGRKRDVPLGRFILTIGHHGLHISREELEQIHAQATKALNGKPARKDDDA